MTTYIIRRLLLTIQTLLIVTLLTTAALRVIPGDAIDVLIGQMDLSGKEDRGLLRAELEKQLGIDVPIYEQYFRWWWNLIVHQDLGDAVIMGFDVKDQIIQRLPVTFELGILAIVIAILISFPVAILSAVRQDSWVDYIFRSLAILFISLPSFWVGIMVIVFPSLWWNWSPPIIYVHIWEDPWENLKMIVLPAVIMGMAINGVNMRLMRTMMLEVVREDYIRTAYSKGLTEKVVIFRHAVKNALIPVITVLALGVPVVIGGSVIIEQIFGLPGMGRLAVEAAFLRDFPVIIGVTLVFSMFVLLIILITDLSYAWLDPRIRYS
ncbi:MAG: ABC transporter permease [Dehalococcoidia bacterium]|nr:ABC transporter permease [Dehalococcoidia bacterium]